MKRKAQDTARRYHELRRQFATATGLADNSVRLDYLAMLSLQIDRVKLRLINGDDTVTSGELLALSDTVQLLSPEPTHEVRICVVHSLPPSPDDNLPPDDPKPASPKPPLPIPGADPKAAL
jgi:hypothetical protein